MLSLYATGTSWACDSARGDGGPALDPAPALAVQLAGLCGLGGATLLWPDYPSAGAGEYARAAVLLPAVALGVAETVGAWRGRRPLLAGAAGRAARTVLVTMVHAVVVRQLAMGGLPVSAFLCAVGAVVTLVPARWFVARAAPGGMRGGGQAPVATLAAGVGSLLLALSGWFLTPSLRLSLPLSATRIEESYASWVLPPDWSYFIAADVSDVDAERVAAALGVALPGPGQVQVIEIHDSRCSRTVKWVPPRFSYSVGCY